MRFAFVLYLILIAFTAYPQNDKLAAERVSDREYVNTMIQNLKELVIIENEATRRAVDKSEAMNVAKFEAQNEWRQQFKDQTETFMTRREFYSAMGTVLGLLLGAMGLFLRNFSIRTRQKDPQ